MTDLDEYFANKETEVEEVAVDNAWFETELQMRLLIDAAMQWDIINIDHYTQDELKMIDDETHNAYNVVVLALWKKFQELDSWMMTRVYHEDVVSKYEETIERLCSRGPGGFERRHDFIRGRSMM